MEHFQGGKALCRRFFSQAARPILDREFPALVYTAGLLGYGSDVLGYDDKVSTDHMWGPRFYLFLDEADLAARDRILEVLSRELPVSFEGCSVNFSPPDPTDGGVRRAMPVEKGPVSPLIFIHTIDGYLNEYLGIADFSSLTAADWLSFSEHKLLALASRELYADGLGLEERLRPLAYYPEEVWLYLIASQWGLISEEQAFVSRCASRGDDIGSRLACARIMDRLMRLCFLYKRTYAPYSKWYGTAFKALDLDPLLRRTIHHALAADDLDSRAEYCAKAQAMVGELHNASGITEAQELTIRPYFNREARVLHVERIAGAVAEQLGESPLAKLPLVGNLSHVGNLTALTDDSGYRERIAALYRD